MRAICIALALLFAAPATAQPCKLPVRLEAGEKAPCTAECLPAPTLSHLLEIREAHERLKIDSNEALRIAASEVEALSSKLGATEAARLSCEADLAVCATPPAPVSSGVSWGVVVGVGGATFAIGVLLGVLVFGG